MSDSTSGVLKRILQGTALIFIGNFLGNVFAFLTRVLAARHLSPFQYGHIVLGITGLWILSLVSLFGLREAIPQKLPRANDRSGLFMMALRLALPASILAAAIVALLSNQVASVLGEEEFGPILVVFAVALPFRVFVRLAVSGFRGVTDPRSRIIIRNICEQGVTVAVVAGGAALGAGAVEIASAWLIGGVAATAVAGYMLTTQTSLLSLSTAFRQRPSKRPISYRTLLAFSLPLMASGVLWTLMRHIDNILLGVLRTGAEIGVYDAAFTLSQTLLIILQVFGFMFLPVFSELHSDEEMVRMRRVYVLITKWIAAVSLPAFMALVAFPETLLTLIFTADYTTGSLALMVITIGFFSHILVGLNIQALTATGDTRIIFQASAIAIITNILFNLTLIPPLGIVGAGVASAASYSLANLYLSTRLYQEYAIQPFSRTFVTLTLVSGGVFFAGYTIVNRFLTSPLHVMVFLLSYGLVHLGVIATVGIDDEDVEVLETIDDQIKVDLKGVVERLT